MSNRKFGDESSAADAELTRLTADWIVVKRGEQPMQWQAWIDFRRRHLGSTITPDNLTVPSDMPPTLSAGIIAYLDAIRASRKAINWNSGARKVPNNSDTHVQPPDNRPLRWWSLPKNLWKPYWREDEIPDGER
jgi:hypothetical protein